MLSRGFKENLKTNFIGKKAIFVDETDSTNALAKREKSSPDGTVFVAKKQTNGRGRRGRVWESEDEKSLYMSILLKPSIDAEKISALTLVVGLAVCRAMDLYAKTEIKWPNDIVINKKKLSGIMCETAFAVEKPEYVVCGIGVNVNNSDFPDAISKTAASLKTETGKIFDIAEIAAKILNEFEPLYKEYLKNGLSNIIEDYKKRCATLSKEVSVVFDNEKINAYALDITEDGGLLVKTSDGEKILNSGEASVRGIYGYV